MCRETDWTAPYRSCYLRAMVLRREEDRDGLLRVYKADKLFGEPLTWKEAKDLRNVLRKQGRGRPKDSNSDLANLLGDWITRRARREKNSRNVRDAQMSERNFERK